MSSHHIVRDEQEPALLFWQPGQLSYEQAGELLEWSPRVVVAQQALREVLAWDIKLDAVWTLPAQQAETRLAVAHQDPVLIQTYRANTKLEEVLQWLKRMNQLSVNLLADAEAQHFSLLVQLAPLQKLIQVQVLSKDWRYSFFQQGKRQKWLPAESIIKIVAFNKAPEVTGAAVMAEAREANLQVYRLTHAGIVEMQAADAFWLGERI